MRRTTKKTAKRETPHYDIFLGLEKKFHDNWIETGETDSTHAENLTREEIALLNGYNVNTGDYSGVCVFQTLGLNSVEIYGKLAAHRLAHYCMMLDNQQK